MNASDNALVVRARNGDRAAFEELVRRTSRLVFARLYLDTGKADRTEDLVQETTPYNIASDCYKLFSPGMLTHPLRKRQGCYPRA